MEQISLNKKSSMGPSVVFENISLELGRTEILKKVSFKMEPGMIHCLIGPNGGGKTSLIRSLLGQMSHGGTIRINWPAGKTIGYVPQTLDLDRSLPVTVNDFMAMICQKRPAFLGISKKYRETISKSLAMVGMGSKGNHLFGELSGGEMQRVLVAQSLVPCPDLLILDEPMTGLDQEGITFFEDLLSGFKNQGTTVLWVHHNLSQVKRLADFVTCINKEVLFSGKPEDVLTSEKILRIYSLNQET